MKEWSLIIKVQANNLSELEEILMTPTNSAEWHIPRSRIIAIMPIHKDDTDI